MFNNIFAPAMTDWHWMCVAVGAILGFLLGSMFVIFLDIMYDRKQRKQKEGATHE